jgi:hypothetical protein
VILPQLVYRVVVDPQFRAALQADLPAAYAAYHLRLSAEEWSALLDALQLFAHECPSESGVDEIDHTKSPSWDGGPAITPAALAP